PFVGAFFPQRPLSAFNGKSGSAVNGTWKLHVEDVYGSYPPGSGPTGKIECWSLSITPAICADGGGTCFADLSIAKTATPEPAAVGSFLTYTLTVTNQGPGPADS